MDPITIMLIAGALGLNKSEEQQQNYKTQQGIEAQKSRFAGFTGQHGQTVQRPNSSDPMMQAMMAGAMTAQGLGVQGGAGGVSEVNPNVSTGLGNGTASNFMGPPPPGAVQSPGMMPSMYAGAR